MPLFRKIPIPDLSNLTQRRRWILLGFITLCLGVLLKLVHAPAYTLIAAIIAGIFIAISGANIKIPQGEFYFAQSIVGAVIATSITRQSLHGLSKNGLMFLLMVLSVSLIAALLGYLLAQSKVLPGTTAIWGTSPGGALTMIVMSEAYGADPRLVAFMQYLRVIMVTFSASFVATISGRHAPPAAAVLIREEAGAYFINLGLTALLCLVASYISVKRKLPLAAMLGPLIVGGALNLLDIVEITVPWWLSVCAYIAVGWNIGLRFNRPILAHAFSALPRIALTMFIMIAICGAASIFFSHAANIDLMSAFLATSPGGIDSVAIIAASVGGDVSLVVAVQTLRLVVVMLTGPALATFVVRKTGWTPEGNPDKNDK